MRSEPPVCYEGFILEELELTEHKSSLFLVHAVRFDECDKNR